MTTCEKKDVWDKLGALSALIASVLVPVVIVVVGNLYTSAMKQSENRVKYTELAIAILKTSPSDDTKNIRAWAVKVIDKYSDVPLSYETRDELLRSKLIEASAVIRDDRLDIKDRKDKLDQLKREIESLRKLEE